jgi:hypothetical protein
MKRLGLLRRGDDTDPPAIIGEATA